MKLAITIPAFNEEKTLGKVINEIPKKIPGIKKIEVIVIDDGSTDKTARIAKKHKAILIRHPGNRGLAKSFSDGVNLALERGADIVMNTDADFQYNQKQIPSVIKPIVEGRADIVLGSRFKGWIEDMPKGKRWGNVLATKVVRFVSGLNISDAQSGFRAFSREAALRMNISGDFTYTQESLLIAAEHRLKVVEVPIDFRKRAGESRLFGSVWSFANRAGKTLMVNYLNYHPLRVFLSMGLFLFIAGALFAYRVLSHYFATGVVGPYLPSAVLSSLLIILGVQVSIMGLVAEMVRHNRKIQEEILYRVKSG